MEASSGLNLGKKLKELQEKDKLLSDLMSDKKYNGKGKRDFQSDYSNQKISRYHEDTSFKPYYKSSHFNRNNYSGDYKKQSRGNSVSSQYNKGNSRNSTAGSFRFQGNKISKALLSHVHVSRDTGEKTQDHWILSVLRDVPNLDFVTKPPFSGV